MSQKTVAWERIRQLNLKAVESRSDYELSSNCLLIMENIASRLDITLTKEIKRSYCKKCKTPYRNCRIRLRKGIISVTCNNCGDIRRIPY
ncbi:MAG: ribonuclease P protein component 4 [Thermoplasmataceae archaeon]|jgi:ribonuclease P protein subunit RPR2